MQNVIYAITNIEKADNEQRQNSVSGAIVDILLKTDSVTGLPKDKFLAGSRAYHPQSGKVYMLNADRSAWVLVATAPTVVPSPEAGDANKALVVNSDGTGFVFLATEPVPAPVADGEVLYSDEGNWGVIAFIDLLREEGQNILAESETAGFVYQAANVPAFEDPSSAAETAVNTILAALKAAGIMAPDAAEGE